MVHMVLCTYITYITIKTNEYFLKFSKNEAIWSQATHHPGDLRCHDQFARAVAGQQPLRSGKDGKLEDHRNYLRFKSTPTNYKYLQQHGVIDMLIVSVHECHDGETSKNLRRGKPFWKNLQEVCGNHGPNLLQNCLKTKMVTCQQSGSMLAEPWGTFWRKPFKFYERTFSRSV